MVKGVNSIGESSAYLFNGKNALVEQTWHIAKNGYGYHDVDAGLEEDTDTGKGGNGSGGKGHGNGNGQGNGNGAGDKPTGTTVGSFSTVVKQFVIDYTVETMDPLMEHEINGLDYRYVYGNERLSVNISPITEGAGHVVESGTMGQQIRLYYHQDLRGTVDYLTSPVSQKVESWTHYNEWGEITHNAVLKMGQRELDLVKNYTGHDFDAVLNMYYAKARMYDAENRRFVALDPFMDGSRYDLRERVTDPVMFVQYLYVKNMPLIRIDILGLNPGDFYINGKRVRTVYQDGRYYSSIRDLVAAFDGTVFSHGNDTVIEKQNDGSTIIKFIDTSPVYTAQMKNRQWTFNIEKLDTEKATEITTWIFAGPQGQDVDTISWPGDSALNFISVPDPDNEGYIMAAVDLQEFQSWYFNEFNCFFTAQLEIGLHGGVYTTYKAAYPWWMEWATGVPYNYESRIIPKEQIYEIYGHSPGDYIMPNTGHNTIEYLQNGDIVVDLTYNIFMFAVERRDIKKHYDDPEVAYIILDTATGTDIYGNLDGQYAALNYTNYSVSPVYKSDLINGKFLLDIHLSNIGRYMGYEEIYGD